VPGNGKSTIVSLTGGSYLEKYPYVRTREVILRNVTIASGRTLKISDKPYIFRGAKVN